MTDKNTLAEIEELGQLQFCVDDVLLIAGINRENLTDEMKQAHRKGRLIASATVRRAILKQAENGSTAAQKHMMDIITKGNEFAALEALESQIGEDNDAD